MLKWNNIKLVLTKRSNHWFNLLSYPRQFPVSSGL